MAKRKRGKKKDKVNAVELPALAFASENNTKPLSKIQKKFVKKLRKNNSANQLFNPKKVNVVETEKVKVFNGFQQAANAMGFYVGLHCGVRVEENSEGLCMGRIMVRLHVDKKKKYSKSGYIQELYCPNCEVTWIFEGNKKFFKIEE